MKTLIWLIKNKYYHLLFWVAYFFLWFYLTAYKFPSINQAIVGNLIYLLCQAGAAYIIVYWLIPKYLYQKRYGYFISSVCLSILIFSTFIAFGMYALLRESYTNWQISNTLYFFSNGIVAILTTITPIALIKQVMNKFAADKRNSLLEKEKLNAELNFLKAQINPHFLFNTINNVYVLIKRDGNAAADGLLKLSDMLRYQLYECNTNTVPLDKEIQHINNYIELEKLRKGKKVIIRKQFSVPSTQCNIPPFLLLTFIENAFKYVSNFADNPNIIDIRIDAIESGLGIYIFNTTEQQKQSANAKGIGLSNVKRRLDLMYSDNYNLQISHNNDTYEVSLKLPVL